jgi:hypothetical protein
MTRKITIATTISFDLWMCFAFLSLIKSKQSECFINRFEAIDKTFTQKKKP